MIEKALEFALIGLIESFMTLKLIASITKTDGNLKMEGFAQGLGNFVCGFTSSLGGCAMIGQSQININSGGLKRSSSFIASIGVLISIMYVGPIIEIIPVSALAGVMFVVVYKTFYWRTFNLLTKYDKYDIFIIFVVTFITILYDLAMAVIIGIALTSLEFI